MNKARNAHKGQLSCRSGDWYLSAEPLRLDFTMLDVMRTLSAPRGSATEEAKELFGCSGQVMRTYYGRIKVASLWQSERRYLQRRTWELSRICMDNGQE
jgi:hypothetical protein